MKTIFVSGCFNVLHPGHMRLLRFAKEYGGRLVVAVESDSVAGSAAHVHEHLRLGCVQSIAWVDEAFIFDESLADLIARLRPSVIVKGKEHELCFNPELAALEQYGGVLVFSSGETRFSSFDLIRKEFQVFDSRSISLPTEYLARHGIDKSRLITVLKGFASLNV